MRYLLVSIIAAIIMTAAAPAHSHSGGAFRGEVGIEIVSESGSNFLTIPHKDFTKEGPISSRSTWRQDGGRTTALSYAT